MSSNWCGHCHYQRGQSGGRRTAADDRGSKSVAGGAPKCHHSPGLDHLLSRPDADDGCVGLPLARMAVSRLAQTRYRIRGRPHSLVHQADDAWIAPVASSTTADTKKNWCYSKKVNKVR